MDFSNPVQSSSSFQTLVMVLTSINQSTVSHTVYDSCVSQVVNP